MSVPILLLIFNRPDTTQLVFDRIRQVRPTKLFIAADGPRLHKFDEAALCDKTRNIVSNIDWPCEVKTRFNKHNIGCKLAVSSSIGWFFEQVEEGIILEDDCLPDPSFFTYCSELLAYYRNNDQVMHIGGVTHKPLQADVNQFSYYFTGFPQIWGWATWRRAWKYYQVDPTENLRRIKLELPYFNQRTLWFIKEIQAGRMDTWDIQWLVTIHSRRGLAISPNVSLIRNIGFGFNATHTVLTPKWLKKMQFGSISSIRHPIVIQIDKQADAYESNHIHKQVWYMRVAEYVYYSLKSVLSKFVNVT